MSLKSELESGKFALTVEVGPQKGTDISEIVEAAEVLRGRVTAANVTDQQSSVMRLGSMVTCHLLADHGLEPILQMTCRDRNRIALQSDLLGAWVLGIQNVLALTGDLPALGDHPDAVPVYDLDSVQLLSVIGRLNEGFDMIGNALSGKTDFFAGAVVKPGADTEASLDLQLFKMESKIKAGAKFFQTQAVYEPDRFARFMKRAEGFGVPIMAGIIPLEIGWYGPIHEQERGRRMCSRGDDPEVRRRRRQDSGGYRHRRGAHERPQGSLSGSAYHAHRLGEEGSRDAGCSRTVGVPTDTLMRDTARASWPSMRRRPNPDPSRRPAWSHLVERRRARHHHWRN